MLCDVVLCCVVLCYVVWCCVVWCCVVWCVLRTFVHRNWMSVLEKIVDCCWCGSVGVGQGWLRFLRVAEGRKLARAREGPSGLLVVIHSFALRRCMQPELVGVETPLELHSGHLVYFRALNMPRAPHSNPRSIHRALRWIGVG